MKATWPFKRRDGGDVGRWKQNIRSLYGIDVRPILYFKVIIVLHFCALCFKKNTKMLSQCHDDNDIFQFRIPRKKHAHKSTSELQLVLISEGNTPHISRSKKTWFHLVVIKPSFLRHVFGDELWSQNLTSEVPGVGEMMPDVLGGWVEMRKLKIPSLEMW